MGLTALEAEILALQISYIKGMESKLCEMRLACDDIKQSQSQEAWNGLHRLAHKLAGSSGTYSFLTLSESARFLEDQMLEYNAKGQKLSSRVLETWLLGLNTICSQYSSLASYPEQFFSSHKQLEDELQKIWKITKSKLLELIKKDIP